NPSPLRRRAGSARGGGEGHRAWRLTRACTRAATLNESLVYTYTYLANWWSGADRSGCVGDMKIETGARPNSQSIRALAGTPRLLNQAIGEIATPHFRI